MNKQNLKTLAVVSVTAASVFFVYKLYETEEARCVSLL